MDTGTQATLLPGKVGVIIPAAGSGRRMGTTRPKQFLELAGKPVLVHTITAFLRYSTHMTVVVVLPPKYLHSARQEIHSFLPSPLNRHLLFTAGGNTRQQSVYNGLQALPDKVQNILVHDGARPLISQAVIDRCLQGIANHGAVVAAVPVKDTLKRVSTETITSTISRDDLWQAQTPQAMQRQLLEQAYAHARQTRFPGTDESSLLEHANISVAVVPGSEQNIKITRPGDLTLAEALLTTEKTAVKIGHGFDAHRLVKGRKLILGGVEIPGELGLDGHSDADVLTHALIDAMLGALGEGDIGRHFPDTDANYKNIDSLKLLKRVTELMQEHNMYLGNADITVVCQHPKLAPFLDKMQSRLALACKTTEKSINIKATTTEKMGFTGRGEGISAHAVVLLNQQV